MKILLSLVLVAALLSCGCAVQSSEVEMKNFYAIEVETIGGETNRLEQYRGKVLLIVNTASKCGFTGQYEGLQKLNEDFKDKGLVVLGFLDTYATTEERSKTCDRRRSGVALSVVHP